MSGEYVTSFALMQKMMHFLQNLEYHMTFEVLEPKWVEMIAKIQSGKVANVDQVQCNKKKSPNVYKSCPKMISLEKW